MSLLSGPPRERLWPLFGLVVRTPRVELRYVDDDSAAALRDREGAPVRALRFVLERAAWQARRRADIEVSGLEPCLPLLGLDSSP